MRAVVGVRRFCDVLEAIGYRADMAQWAAAGDATIGRVVRVDRGAAVVMSEQGPLRATYGGDMLALIAHDQAQTPCTGDWCVLRLWPDDRTTIDRLIPRRTSIVRATAGEQSHGQVLCADVDLAAVVVALHPLPSMAKTERLLALAWASGAQPLVVLTKADLVCDAVLVRQDIEALAPGVEVVCTSTVTGQGIDRLREVIDGRLTMALFGSSGHGKSSLTNALVGAVVLATRSIREDGRGRHTSVRRELVMLPGGGAVIDTPGLRSAGLVDDRTGLTQAFADVEALVARCRFSNCAHDGEPGCAVAAALENGSLAVRRFESWQQLQREMSWFAARKDARLRAERLRERKRRAKEVRPSRR